MFFTRIARAETPNGVSERQLCDQSIKRIADCAFSILALLAFMPLLLLIASMLLVFQGRPLFIRHKRLGRHGVIFPCLKFRTMVENADVVLKEHLDASPASALEWADSRKLKVDPRVTPLGRFLRASSLDELPQLWNICIGEMSLVGPRPIVSDEVPFYGAHIDAYFRVRPGLTGLWQVSGRNDVSYSERVKLDVHYVENWKFSRDLLIIVKTIPAVVRSRGCY